MLKKIKRKNKKAISAMIGYILLISIAVVMSVIIFTWLKTYIPKAALECPDTTSLFIKNYTCVEGGELNLTIRNNGNFNVAGYFIRVANVSGQELATIDLSQKLKSEFGGITIGNSILVNESSTLPSNTPSFLLSSSISFSKSSNSLDASMPSTPISKLNIDSFDFLFITTYLFLILNLLDLTLFEECVTLLF